MSAPNFDINRAPSIADHSLILADAAEQRRKDRIKAELGISHKGHNGHKGMMEDVKAAELLTSQGVGGA